MPWLFYWLATIFFSEMVLHLSIGSVFSVGIIFPLIFGVSIGSIFYLLAAAYSEKTNRFWAGILHFGLAALFISQLIYYRTFKTFYTIYSMGNLGQGLEFMDEIVLAIFANWLPTLLFLLPAIGYLFLRQKITISAPLSGRKIGGIVLLSLFFHGLGLVGIGAAGKGENSPYNLYYNRHYPQGSVGSLGLLTYMRLDFMRQITAWSPYYAPQLFGGAGQCPVEAEPDSIQYNVLEIDFDALIAQEDDQEIRAMHEYFKSVPPTAKNDKTGLFAGYNFIFLTAEAFSHLAVDANVTPTLYKMMYEGYYFENFYTPLWGVSTTDGEYTACTGLIPKGGVWSFKESSANYLPFVMGNQFKKLGYSSRAYHNHTYNFYMRHLSHPNMGYEFKALGRGLEVEPIWPESDLEMMELSIPEYITDQPFHVYYMTVSGHLPYSFRNNAIAGKNRSMVETLPYCEQAQAYLAAHIELDRALAYLLQQLQEAGLAENTLIALSADHYPYGLDIEAMEELNGGPIETHFELYRNAFLLYAPGMEPTTVSKPVSSLDIIPTLSNLLGLEFDSRLLMGVDAFSDGQPLVIFANGSFISNRGRYNADLDVFTPRVGHLEDEAYRQRISHLVNEKFFYSARILDTDYYAKTVVK